MEQARELSFENGQHNHTVNGPQVVTPDGRFPIDKTMNLTGVWSEEYKQAVVSVPCCRPSLFLTSSSDRDALARHCGNDNAAEAI